jgi:nitrilase
MTASSRFTAAVVQAGSILFDTKRTLEKLGDLAADAAGKGAHLVLFPEAFIGGYPKSMDFGARLGGRTPQGRDEFLTYYNGAIEVPGPECDRIAAAARANKIHLVVGIIERAGGTLYCTALTFAPDGSLAAKHRKVMPTAMERIVWGFGDGSTLPVIDTPLGKLGTVICWENYMPLMRTAMYAKGIQIYCAPTADDRDTWLPSMQMIALEGRCFVVSSCQFLTSAAFPPGHSARRDGNEEKILMRGGSCIVGPLGKVIVAPFFDKEGIEVAEIDLADTARGKYDFDVVGHYARPDIFQLVVNESVQSPVITKT